MANAILEATLYEAALEALGARAWSWVCTGADGSGQHFTERLCIPLKSGITEKLIQKS